MIKPHKYKMGDILQIGDKPASELEDGDFGSVTSINYDFASKEWLYCIEGLDSQFRKIMPESELQIAFQPVF